MLLTTRQIDLPLIVGTLFFLVPYNLAMYGINDVYDYESDLANPRKDSIEGALVPQRLHRPLLRLVALINVPFVVVLVWWGNASSWLALFVSLAAVVAYSAPRLRFKERPVLDSITSSTHFVSPAVVGLTMAEAEFTRPLWVTLGAFFLWGMAAHAFGAVQDVVPDRKAGIGSIATVFGARVTVRAAAVMWTAAGLLMLTVPTPGAFAAVVVVPYLINAAPYWNVTDSNSGSVNRAWRHFIWLNYAAGFVVTLILIGLWR